MRVTAINTSEPLCQIEYLNVTRHGRPMTETLHVWRVEVDTLPPTIEALVLAADLQGREKVPRYLRPQQRLLGEIVAEELAFLSETGDLPSKTNLAVALAGDIYAEHISDNPAENKRGGHGDCRPVLSAFSSMSRWTCAVLGNHDGFGDVLTQSEIDKIEVETGAHILDGRVVTFDGLRIGGVSGTIGDAKEGRPWRRPLGIYQSMVEDVLLEEPDIILMHDGPSYQERGLAGSDEVRQSLEAGSPALVVRGHRRWNESLVELNNGTQVLNVDAKVVILFPKGGRP